MQWLVEEARKERREDETVENAGIAPTTASQSSQISPSAIITPQIFSPPPTPPTTPPPAPTTFPRIVTAAIFGKTEGPKSSTSTYRDLADDSDIIQDGDEAYRGMDEEGNEQWEVLSRFTGDGKYVVGKTFYSDLYVRIRRRMGE